MEPDIYDPSYVAKFGSCREFGGYLAACGFEVELQHYFFGCATGLSGRKSKGP